MNMHFTFALILACITALSIVSIQPTNMLGGLKAEVVTQPSSTHIPPAMQWIETFEGGGYGFSVIQTRDGGYALAGNFGLIKTDAFGNAEWKRTYEPASANSVIQSTDSGYVLAGYQGIPGPLGTRLASWLAKTDSEGNIEWNESVPEGTMYTSIVQTGDGEYAAVGHASPNYYNLVRIDAFGKILWNQTYPGGYFLDQNNDVPSLVQTVDGGFAIAGSSGIMYPAPVTPDDFMLMKTDSWGKLQWNETYEFIVKSQINQAYSLVQTSDEGFAVVGQSVYSAKDSESVLFKVDKNGNLQWNQIYPSTEARSIIQTSDGGFAIAAWRPGPPGMYMPMFSLIKTDSIGAIEWNQTYGGTGFQYVALSLAQANDGGFVMAGPLSSDPNSHGNSPIVGLIKIAPPDGMPPLTPSLTQIPSLNPSSFPNATPSIPELPSWIILSAVAITTLLAVTLAMTKKTTKYTRMSRP